MYHYYPDFIEIHFNSNSLLIGASLVAQRLQASASNEGDPGSIPGSGRSPGEGNGNPLQYSCLETPMDGESHGRRNLGDYSPRGLKESDTTEQLHFHFHIIKRHKRYVYIVISC